MKHRLHRLIVLFPLFLIAAVGSYGQSPADERWDAFVGNHPGSAIQPEDEILGPLADMRRPDSSWASGIDICEAAFNAVAEGRVPEDLFLPAARLPLTVAFERVLAEGGRDSRRRYGSPVKEGVRLTVPVRIDGGSDTVNGHIYLVLSEGRWYIDQWALDLSDLPLLSD